jgi:cytochrome c553
MTAMPVRNHRAPLARHATHPMLTSAFTRAALTRIGVVLATFGFVSAVQAADIAAGRAKHEQACAACHGKDANSPIDPSYPKLAGQHRDYLERALLDYRAGGRKNAIMAAQAQALSRADITNLSAFYASLPGSLKLTRP